MASDQPHPHTTLTQSERLDTLSREYRPALSRYFGKRAYQQADVEDLVQEVLVRLAVRGDGSDIEQPEAYLMRTATNVTGDATVTVTTASMLGEIDKGELASADDV